MAAVAVEFSFVTATVVDGTNVDGATLGSIGGTIISGIDVVKTETIGNSTTYTFLVVHDTAAGPTALEYSVRSVTIANNAASSVDNVYRTIEGAGQAVVVHKTSSRGQNTTYDIIVVHLAA